jgi:iron(III) transport system substrate-binding protein
MFAKKSIFLIGLVVFALIIIVLYTDQVEKPARSVVIYTTVDQVYSEPILKDFETRTGIQVLPIYDVEATKTTGMVNRLIAEKNRPLADVFWNGEFAQTILLKEQDVLEVYKSPSSGDIPAEYLDPEGYWAGFGGRARVLLVNSNMVSPDNYPDSIFDLLSSDIPGKQIGIAYPMFGTSATHASALYASLGQEKARDLYDQLKSRDVRVVDGNSVVRDLVADGQLSIGLTDTDDACGAIRDGAPVQMIFPDQQDGGIGTLIIPNTVAMINGAPHSDEAKELIDYLLSKEVEGKLLASGSIQIPVRNVDTRSECPGNIYIKGMNVSGSDIFQLLIPAKKDMSDIFIK